MIHQMSSLQAGHYTDHTIPTHATLHSEIILYSNSECFWAGMTKLCLGYHHMTSWLRTTQKSLNLCHKNFLPHILLSHIYNFGASYMQTFSSEVFILLLFTVISGHCNLPSYDNTSTKTLTITFTLVNSMFTFTIQWQIQRQMTVMNYTGLQLISLLTIL